MTLSTLTSRVSYPGTGSTGPFAIPFRFLATADLLVTKRSAAGTETALALTTHYTVTGANEATGNLTLVTALAVGETLVIRRKPAITQPTSIRNQGAYYPATIEDEFDRLAMQIQGLKDELDRTPKLAETYDPAGLSMTGLVPRANQVVAFNSTGTGIESRSVSDGATTLPGGGRTVATLTEYLANNSVYNIKDFGATGGGVTNDRTFIANADAAAVLVGAGLYGPLGTYLVSSNLTISSAFNFAPGGLLKLAAGVTGTLNGYIPPAATRIFDTSANYATTFISLGSATPVVLPEWWGAKADGTAGGVGTDSSAPFNAAINQGRRVKLAAGRYLANVVHTSGYSILDGAGCDATFIRSVSSSGYAIREAFAGSGWRRHLTLNDLCLEGDASSRSGFEFGDSSTYTSGAELYGRCEFNRIHFLNCKYGVRKAYGNIGNVYNDCTWRGTQDFGYHARGRNAGGFDATAGLMQTGSDIFNGGHMGEVSLAAIYVDDEAGSAGQNVYNGLIIEGNPGFGVFVKNYANQGAGPMAFHDVWQELNGTVGSVTIDGTAYTPGDFYFRNAEHVVLSRVKRTGRMQLVNSSVREVGCVYYQDTVVADATSSLVIDDAYMSQANIAAGLVRSYLNLSTQFGGAGNIFLVPPRATVAKGYTTVWSEPYSGAGPWSFTGTAGASATSVNDGILFQTCAELVIPNTYTLLPNVTEFTFTSGRYYVYTIDVKLTTATTPTTLQAAGAGTLFPNAASRLVQNKWVTIGGIGKASSTNTAIVPRIINSTGVSVTLRFSAAQVVEFTSKQDAIDYFNARLYCATVAYQGSATFNPANLVDGAGETTTVTVTGAAVGDIAQATFSNDLQGIDLHAWVSAANTVSCRFQNETTGTIDLASGTLRVAVRK